MAKYRKKPVVIEAWQLVADAKASDLPSWIIDGLKAGIVTFSFDGDGKHGIIKTLEGDHRASLGDWIIRGVAGELYPCKPEIFAQTYEPA